MANDLYEASIFDTPDIKTKMKILHAVDKSLDRITISEICENAEISRQTFYRHFKSKYDIPSWHIIFCRQFYLNEIGRTISWEVGYYHHLRLITQEREFYRKAIQYTINEPFGQTFVPENRKNVMFETLTKWRNIPIDYNLQFLVETFSKVECEILNDWLRSDKRVDLLSWTNDLVSIVPDRLYGAMQLNHITEPAKSSNTPRVKHNDAQASTAAGRHSNSNSKLN